MIISFNEFNYLTLIEKRKKERNEKEKNLAFNNQFKTTCKDEISTDGWKKVKVVYLNYHHILVFCFNLKVAPLTSSLPPVVSFSYVQERMLVNSEHIMRPALRLFSVSNQERILVQFETKTKLRLFTVLNAI